MMILALAIVLLAGISLLLGWYFRQAEQGAVQALQVWKALSSNLNRLVIDDSVPEEAARRAAIYATMAGCGCIASGLALHVTLKHSSARYRRRLERETASADLRALGPTQKRLLRAILRDVVRIDVLCSPYLRFLMNSSLKTALSLADNPAARDEIADLKSVMSTANAVAERKIRSHKLPNQELLEPLTLAA